MGVKRSRFPPVEVTPETTGAVATPAVSKTDALRELMAFYESGEVGDEEENAADLMIQLSDVTYKRTQSDD
ncbi:MAG: hypothetical protein H0X43_06935 [Nitrosospira sp.]|nr:hypothetical protein [Nitrosospira sp.]